MKSLVSHVSLLLTVLNFAATLAIKPVLSQTTVPPQLNALDQENVTAAVPLIEQAWEKEYEDYFKTNFSDKSMTVRNIADTLGKIASQTQKKNAIVYIISRPQQLELILLTPEGKPIHKRVLEAKQEVLKKQVQEFSTFLSNPLYKNSNRYRQSAQQLYRWMIAPIEADLKAQNIDTLLFCVGERLRTLPFAALHDGQQFLIEKYSFSRIPAFKLTDTVYSDLRNSQVLAMGASEFKDQAPLPAVPVELSAIMKNQWQGKLFLNQEFTLTNFLSQRASQPFKIIHLATHADFQSGVPSNSYIQFWDTKLTLDKALHNRRMKCINCQSSLISKNGHRRGKQCYVCRTCGRQFLEYYDTVGYQDAIKQHCLELYVNGMGFRAIERVTGVNHNTIINWVKKVGNSLPEGSDYSEIPEVSQVDELQTFVGKKK